MDASNHNGAPQNGKAAPPIVRLLTSHAQVLRDRSSYSPAGIGRSLHRIAAELSDLSMMATACAMHLEAGEPGCARQTADLIDELVRHLVEVDK